MFTPKERVLVHNNAGLVTTTGGNDAVHTILYPRTCLLRKIHWFNNTGANGTLIFGTLDAAVPAVFVPLMPAILCLNGFSDILREEDIVDVEWKLDRSAAAAGRTGNIVVLASVAGITLRCTVEERG